MDFTLSEEHKMIQTTMRDFAENEVRSKVKEFERQGAFPEELVNKLGELGFMGIFVPEQYGGTGMDILAYAIAEEELARVWPSLGLIMSANNSLSAAPILKFGTEEQRQKYLAPLARGEKLGCYALTESDAGSDAAALKTSAKLENGIWVLSGTKRFITNVAKAQICVLIARTSDEAEARARHRHLSAFIIETSAPGFSVGKTEDKICLHSSPTSEIILGDCKIPEANLLGQIGDGWKVAMYTLNGGRINIAAQSVGIARGAYEEAVAYAKDRKMFGGSEFDLQDVRFKLARMKVQIDAGRFLTWRAAWLKDNSPDEMEVAVAAAEAKYFAAEAAQQVTYDAVQIHGGLGVIKDVPVAMFFCDARPLTIYEGASEVQLEVISRQI